MSLKTLLPPLVLAIAVIACSKSELSVNDPWIREAPPGATALAGYCVIDNPSASERRLVGAQSPDFGAIEIHRSFVDGQMARMQMEKSVALPAGESATFGPGGRHLMLLKPKRTLAEGDTVQVTLEFEDGSHLPVEFPVRKGS